MWEPGDPSIVGLWPEEQAVGVRLFLAAIAAVFLSSCGIAEYGHDPEAVFETPEAYAASDRVAELVRKRDLDGFFDTFPTDVPDREAKRKSLVPVFGLLPDGKDLKVNRFYSELRAGEGEYAGVPVYLTVYDVEGDKGFAQLTLAVYPENGTCCVTSYINVIESDQRPSAFNAFTFEGKGWVHYLMFGLLIGIPVFMIATAILCFREKRVRHRWLWIPFILVGLWGVTFNWTTGAIQSDLVQISPQGIFFNFIKVYLLGAGIVTVSYFQPWILSIGSPVGAVAYFVRRRFYKPPAEPLRSYETPA